MAILQPQGTQFLNTHDHAEQHRIFANDEAAPVQSIKALSDGRIELGYGTAGGGWNFQGTVWIGGQYIRYDVGNSRFEASKPLYSEGDQLAKIKTGTYTGDGSTGQAITGIGFTPQFIAIVDHPDSDYGRQIWIKLNQSWADYAVRISGIAGFECYSRTSGINSLDADGFTVDDNGSDDHPNKNGQVYDYIILG